MGAQHAVLPFMGRHNPFIQPVGGAQPSVVPAGKFAPPTSGVAAVQPGFEHLATASATASANASAAPSARAYAEAAPVAARNGVSAAPSYEPDSPQAPSDYAVDEKHYAQPSPSAAPAAAAVSKSKPHYASATAGSGSKAKSAVGNGAGARSAITQGGAHVNLASNKRQLKTYVARGTTAAAARFCVVPHLRRYCCLSVRSVGRCRVRSAANRWAG